MALTKTNFSFFILIVLSICVAGQNTASYKVRYIKYFGDEKKIINDTTMIVSLYPVYNTWYFIVGKDTLSNGIVSCNCSIEVYDNKENLLESVYDPSGDEDFYTRSSCLYN